MHQCYYIRECEHRQNRSDGTVKHCVCRGVNHGKFQNTSRVKLFIPLPHNLTPLPLGTFLHIAHSEGLVLNSSIHAGIRAPLMRPHGDLRNDRRCGFSIVTARDIDRIGVKGVVRKLKERVGGTNVYISVDIDVLDVCCQCCGHLLLSPSSLSLASIMSSEKICSPPSHPLQVRPK